MSEIFVCAEEDFPVGSRRLVKAGLRNIAVYNHRGRLYALDNACYHHGGPLLNGDIEDLGGHPCVKCPWHSYKITLDTGEGMYFGVELDGGQKPCPKLKSKGVKQRTHEVYVRGGRVYVRVDASGPHIESDTYAEMEIANREKATPTAGLGVRGGQGGGSRLHSSLGSSNGVVDANRSGAFLAGGPRASSGGRGSGSGDDALKTHGVKLVKVTDAAKDARMVKTFTFDKVNALDRRRVAPGMWVELRLPAGADGSLVTRKWTVTSVRGALGGWFSITVRHRPDGGGGSRWLYGDAAKGTPIELVGTGGDFTLDALMERINERRGKVLMLSAGIGITPLFAAAMKQASDPFATVSGPPMHIVHVHTERRLAETAYLDELAQVCAQFGENDPRSTPFSYRLQLRFTQSRDGVSPIVAGLPTEQRRLSIEDVKAALDVIDPPQDGTGSDAAASAAPARRRVLAMVCGPQEFMAAAEAYCVACGIDRNDVTSESFDD